MEEDVLFLNYKERKKERKREIESLHGFPQVLIAVGHLMNSF